MSTELFAITNTSLNGKDSFNEWEKIIENLNELKNDNSKINKWNFEIEPELDIYPFNVSFYSSNNSQPTLYENICVIKTIYKYNLIYQNYTLDWFVNFRNELHQIIKILGGTEVIFLAYGAPNRLSHYLENMAWENVSYEEIKTLLIQEFGQPITNYADLNLSKLDYKNIKEFFLDDFSDLNF